MSRGRGRPATSTSALVPAGARGETALDDIEAVLNEEAVEMFAKAVGGRQALADTLCVAGSSSKEVERITTLLLDPRYAGWGLARLCTTVGITVAELFASYRKAMIVRAQIASTHAIAAKLPEVVTDVMDRAAPRTVACETCKGSGTLEGAPCWRCEGRRTVQTEPELDRQKLALELGQLLEKKGGLLIQQNNVAANLGGTGTGSLEQLQQAVGDLLFGSSRQADGDDGSEFEVEATPVDLPDNDDDDNDPEELPTADATP